MRSFICKARNQFAQSWVFPINNFFCIFYCSVVHYEIKMCAILHLLHKFVVISFYRLHSCKKIMQRQTNDFIRLKCTTRSMLILIFLITQLSLSRNLFLRPVSTRVRQLLRNVGAVRKSKFLTYATATKKRRIHFQ